MATTAEMRKRFQRDVWARADALLADVTSEKSRHHLRVGAKATVEAVRMKLKDLACVVISAPRHDTARKLLVGAAGLALQDMGFTVAYATAPDGLAFRIWRMGTPVPKTPDLEVMADGTFMLKGDEAEALMDDARTSWRESES